jgi:hypothetical protein
VRRKRIEYSYPIVNKYNRTNKMESQQTNTVNEVKDALIAIVRSALCQGFNKSSYLVTNHIQYIKNIQTANKPEGYIISVAKKLFPDEKTIIEKSNYLKQKYRDDLLSKFKTLYALYNKIAQEAISQKNGYAKKTISEAEANEILDELLCPSMGLDAMYL